MVTQHSLTTWDLVSHNPVTIPASTDLNIMNNLDIPNYLISLVHTLFCWQNVLWMWLRHLEALSMFEILSLCSPNQMNLSFHLHWLTPVIKFLIIWCFSQDIMILNLVKMLWRENETNTSIMNTELWNECLFINSSSLWTISTSSSSTWSPPFYCSIWEWREWPINTPSTRSHVRWGIQLNNKNKYKWTWTLYSSKLISQS